MLWFMIFLFGLNVIAIVSLFTLLLYNNKGIKFLVNTKRVIKQNGDAVALAKISNKDFPALIECFNIVKSSFYFTIFTLNINIIVFVFVLYPASMLTEAWGTMIWLAAGTNSFMLITFRSFAKTKELIDATCVRYNALLNTYDFMKEENNDSAG